MFPSVLRNRASGGDGGQFWAAMFAEQGLDLAQEEIDVHWFGQYPIRDFPGLRDVSIKDGSS